MKGLFTYMFSLLVLMGVHAQSSSVSGSLVDDQGEPVMFANVILFQKSSNQLFKVETTNEEGKFNFSNIADDVYSLKASYIGFDDFVVDEINLTKNKEINLGELQMQVASVQLETAIVTAQRSMVEVKPDRTVFNVEGTVNSAGDNGLGLLRKAPGLLVDNNNNVSVLGRTGVLFFVDGKRLPLSGDDLTNYLENLPAEQIDRIDIISNPGAKYEAEGNAGIIDIRLKKSKRVGYNGTVNATFTQGLHARGNLGASGNFRNKSVNVFGGIMGNMGERSNEMRFNSEQNGFKLREGNHILNSNERFNVRFGTDVFLNKNSTIGFLVSTNLGSGDMKSSNRSEISSLANPTTIDSILVANNTAEDENNQSTYNINYVYQKAENKFNIDLDYGRYRKDNYFIQPNRYYDATETQLFSEVLTEYDTPTDIDIYTFKSDYETPIWGGQFGVGLKFSKVATENTYLFYDIKEEERVRNDKKSNEFDYDEMVYAGYVSYARPLTEKINMSAGLRVEQTDATGDLRAFDPSLSEPPVDLDYIDFFPNVGLTYQHSPMHNWALNFGRRINRPDYNVLNPFRLQLSELSFSKGNARLDPEIVNNIELGYTYQYMYNFKLAYSRTTDQITRLIGPDDEDPRAGFISWENLATQTIYSANVSAPIRLKPWWSMFVNASASYQDNRADYGDEGMVDVQAFNYNFFQQSTFNLPMKWKLEISGWFSGPGIWGGVFKYDPSYSLNVGLQRKFLGDRLNFKINANDITYQTGWSGVSEFNGLKSTGRGNWDSRNVTIALSYSFGNNKIKSRKRKTGLEEESGRIGQE